jgi:hypothetical protein
MQRNDIPGLIRITPMLAPLAPSQDTTSDQIAAFYRPNTLPFVRHSPLPAIGSAQANGAIISISQTIARKIVGG